MEHGDQIWDEDMATRGHQDHEDLDKALVRLGITLGKQIGESEDHGDHWFRRYKDYVVLVACDGTALFETVERTAAKRARRADVLRERFSGRMPLSAWEANRQLTSIEDPILLVEWIVTATERIEYGGRTLFKHSWEVGRWLGNSAKEAVSRLDGRRYYGIAFDLDKGEIIADVTAISRLRKPR